MTLFRKSVDQEDGELMPQRTILLELEFRLFVPEGEGVKASTSWVSSQPPGGDVNFFLPAVILRWAC